MTTHPSEPMTPPPTPTGHDAEPTATGADGMREALTPTPSTDEIRYRVEHDWEPYGDGSFDRWLTAHVAAVVAEKDAEIERLREYIEGWKGENALIARQRDAQVEKTIRAWTERDQTLGVVAAVKALADHLGGPVAADLRAVLGPVSGAVDGAGEAVDHRAWVCARCGEAPEMHAGANSRCIYDPILRATPVAEHEQEVRAGEAHHGHETWAWNCVLPDADRPNGDHRDESVTCKECAARTPEATS